MRAANSVGPMFIIGQADHKGRHYIDRGDRRTIPDLVNG
jgi:hypothetical protein